MVFSKKKISVILIIITVISVMLQLYSIDFSLPLSSDPLGFTLRAIDYSHGDFTLTPKQQPGWSLLIAPFLLLLNSDKFIDYANVTRVLSLAITSGTIFVMYAVARKFFNEKYSLVASSLIAFEPHLNRWAGLGYSEPLYNLVILGSFYFILSKNLKHVYLSFLLAGLLWWVRPNGIIMIIAVSIIFFVNFRKSTAMLKKFPICIAIFFIVISPILIQRDIQYGSPFYVYYGDSIFVKDYAMMGAANVNSTNEGMTSYIQQNGFGSLVNHFVWGGTAQILEGIVKLSFPYLIILVPFGMMFSLRPVDQDKKHIVANWILILVIVGSLAIPYATIQEYRFLFSLFPFLIIFATIPIQRVVNYGLSTFSYSEKKKNIFLVMVVGIILVMGGLFLMRYEKPDTIETQEQIELAKFLENNLKGKILDAGYSTQYLPDIKLDDPPGAFKTYKISSGINRDNEFPYGTGNVVNINVYGKSMDDLISNGEKYGLKYIAINENGAVFYKFLNDVYDHENKYPYLVKVFDSNEKRFQKFKVKIFEIDYTKYHDLVQNQIS